MEKYLVTGGAGFIGSHIVEKLVSRGDKVRVLDNLDTGKKENLTPFLKKIEFLEGDIRNFQTCREACREVDYVLHEAALGSVPRSVDNPLEANEINSTGTLNMLLASREARVKRFVYASSCAVYGDDPILPKKETMSVKPLSPYALSKYAGECYTTLFFKLYHLETVALRYFNVFGPRQDPHSQYAAVIPAFISTLLNGKQPVVYGDGTQSRDFSYVEDVVAANLLACKADKEACGKSYNIAYHQRITINDLFQELKDLLIANNGKLNFDQPRYEPVRAGDVKDSLADISEAKKYLKYTPRFDLRTAFEKTVNSFLIKKDI